jgi:type VI secretion system protein VasG
MGLNLKSLIGKLNDPMRGTLEAAAGLCLARTHYDVEIEHFLLKLLDSSDNDFACILKHFGVDKSRLAAEITRALDKLKSGNARTPSLSPHLLKMMTEAWSIGSIDHGGTQVRSGFAVLALAGNDDLARIAREMSREFQKIEAESLRKDFSGIVSPSVEEDMVPEASAPAAGQRPAGGKTPFMDQYTHNLTDSAKQGKIDPVLARDAEIRQVVDILTRRRQNDPRG